MPAPVPEGRLVAIHLCPAAGAAPRAVAEAVAEAGAGLVGDRHHPQPAADGGVHEVSLIAAEALAHLEAQGLGLAPGAHRRQLTVSGVDLDRLAGRAFRVGEVHLQGTKAAHPCAHLEALTRPGVKAALAGRGGLYARILRGGTLRVGDRVREEA